MKTLSLSKRQIHELAAVQRKILDPLVLDYFADLRIGGSQQRSRFVTVTTSDLSHLHQQVHALLAPYLQGDPLANLSFEIRKLGFDRVLSDRKGRST